MVVGETCDGIAGIGYNLRWLGKIMKSVRGRSRDEG